MMKKEVEGNNKKSTYKILEFKEKGIEKFRTFQDFADRILEETD